MNWPTASLVMGLGIVVAAVLVIAVCRLRAHRDPGLARLRSGWLLAAALLGAPLSYVPWPVAFTDVQPGPTTLQWVGVPVPMVAQRVYRGRHLLDPAFHIFAWVLNGTFAVGVAHGVAYLRAARGSTPFPDR